MWDERFEQLLRCHLSFLPADSALGAESSLRDLGLDSLGAVELLGALEKAYRVRFVDDLLSMDTFATAGTLWAAVDQLAHAPAE
jgi:acyl carrier protein